MAANEVNDITTVVKDLGTAFSTYTDSKCTLSLKFYNLVSVIASSKKGSGFHYIDEQGRTWVAEAPENAKPSSIARMVFNCDGQVGTQP